MASPGLGGLVVSVKVVQGRGLVPKDRIGAKRKKTSSDPYATVLLEEKVIGRTRTIWKTLDPHWDEYFSLRLGSDDANRILGSGGRQQIEIRITDKDKTSSDDPMGVVFVPLPPPSSGGAPPAKWYSVQKGQPGTKHYCHNAKGEIQVSVFVTATGRAASSTKGGSTVASASSRSRAGRVGSSDSGGGTSGGGTSAVLAASPSASRKTSGAATARSPAPPTDGSETSGRSKKIETSEDRHSSLAVGTASSTKGRSTVKSASSRSRVGRVGSSDSGGGTSGGGTSAVLAASPSASRKTSGAATAHSPAPPTDGSETSGRSEKIETSEDRHPSLAVGTASSTKGGSTVESASSRSRAGKLGTSDSGGGRSGGGATAVLAAAPSTSTGRAASSSKGGSADVSVSSGSKAVIFGSSDSGGGGERAATDVLATTPSSSGETSEAAKVAVVADRSAAPPTDSTETSRRSEKMETGEDCHSSAALGGSGSITKKFVQSSEASATSKDDAKIRRSFLEAARINTIHAATLGLAGSARKGYTRSAGSQRGVGSQRSLRSRGSAGRRSRGVGSASAARSAASTSDFGRTSPPDSVTVDLTSAGATATEAAASQPKQAPGEGAREEDSSSAGPPPTPTLQTTRWDTPNSMQHPLSAATESQPPLALQHPMSPKSLQSGSARFGLSDSIEEEERGGKAVDITSQRTIGGSRDDVSGGRKASEPTKSKTGMWGGASKHPSTSASGQDAGGRSGGGGSRMSMRSVFALLWDRESLSVSGRYSSDTAPTKRMSLFDPDGLAAAAIAAEEEDRAEVWAARKRSFGRVCRIALIAMAVVGVVAGISVGIIAATRPGSGVVTTGDGVPGATTSGDGGSTASSFVGFDPSPEVETVCAEENINEQYGYDDCHNLCEEAYCCFVPDWNTQESCAKTQKDDCAPYYEVCHLLDDTRSATHARRMIGSRR